MNPHAPNGLGFWVAFERALSLGGKEDDLKIAIDRCHAAGATWVALRGGAGGANDAATTERSFQAFVDAGIDPYVWVFAYKPTRLAEIAGYHKFFEWGAKGAIINAEFQYEAATAVDARLLVNGIRDAWRAVHGDDTAPGFVAHAPPDYLGAGVGWQLRDELVALDEVCDAIMPQIYAWEHDDKGHAYHLAKIVAGYNARGYGPDKVWPIGCTYRPKTRSGKPVPLMVDEQGKIAKDLVDFLDHPMMKVQAPSLYSLDAISWINGVGDRTIQALYERVVPYLPPPPEIPSGVLNPNVDRLEWDAKE